MEIDIAVRRLAALAQPSRLAVFRLLVKAGPDGLPAGEIARALEELLFRRVGGSAHTRRGVLQALCEDGLERRDVWGNVRGVLNKGADVTRGEGGLTQKGGELTSRN